MKNIKNFETYVSTNEKLDYHRMKKDINDSRKESLSESIKNLKLLKKKQDELFADASEKFNNNIANNLEERIYKSIKHYAKGGNNVLDDDIFFADFILNDTYTMIVDIENPDDKHGCFITDKYNVYLNKCIPNKNEVFLKYSGIHNFSDAELFFNNDDILNYDKGSMLPLSLSMIYLKYVIEWLKENEIDYKMQPTKIGKDNYIRMYIDLDDEDAKLDDIVD